MIFSDRCLDGRASQLPSGISVRVPAPSDALWTLDLPFEVFQHEICREALSLSRLHGSFPNRQVFEILDDDDASGALSSVSFPTRGVSHHDDLRAPDRATFTASEAIVPSSIAELNFSTASSLSNPLQGLASPFFRKVLFSMANNFAGLRTSAGPQILQYLLKETNQALYELILSIPGPSGQAIVQSIFRCAIEMGDVRVLEQLLIKKAAVIGLDQLFCFEIDEKVATPIERAVILRHHSMVELLLDYNVDANRTYPEGRSSHGGVLACASSLDASLLTDLDPRLIHTILNAGGEIAPKALMFLINSKRKELSHSILLNGTPNDVRLWLDHGIFNQVVLKLEERLVMNLFDSLAKVGLDLISTWTGESIIDLAAKSGKFDFFKILYEKKVPVTDRTLAYGIESGNEDLIRFLLFNLRLNPCPDGWHHDAPLAAAITLQQPWVIEFLIHPGAISQTAKPQHLRAALIAALEVGDTDLGETIIQLLNDKGSEMPEPALGLAIENGMDALALHMIDAGANVHYDHCLPLVKALKCRNKPMVLALLDAILLRVDGEEEYSPKSAPTSTLWQLAISWGDRIMIQALIDVIAEDVPFISSNWVTRNVPLSNAMKQEKVELFELFLEAGADIHYPGYDQYLGTALSCAVLIGDVDLVARLLLEWGADPHDPLALREASAVKDDEIFDMILENHQKRYPKGRKEFGSAALISAIDADDMKRITKLIRKKADCNYLNKYDEKLSALGSAICRNDDKRDSLVELFIQEGRADPNGAVRIIYERCLTGFHYDHRITALVAAVRKKNISTIRLLIKHGANVNLPLRGSFKRTPLQAAAEVGSMEIVQLLLDHGADVNAAAAQRGGGTALQFAAAGGYAALVCRLLSHGAEVNGPGSKVDGLTALEAAARHGRLDTVRILLNAGAASNLETGKQITNAIALAEDQGHTAVSSLLTAHVRRDSISGVLQDDGDVDVSGEENGDGTVDHAVELSDRDEGTIFTEFAGEGQWSIDFGGWNEGLPDWVETLDY